MRISWFWKVFLIRLVFQEYLTSIFNINGEHRKHKKLSCCHKLWFSNPYNLASRCRRPLIFQTFKNSLSLKFQRFTLADINDIGIGKFEFVARTQLLILINWNLDKCPNISVNARGTKMVDLHNLKFQWKNIESFREMIENYCFFLRKRTKKTDNLKIFGVEKTRFFNEWANFLKDFDKMIVFYWTNYFLEQTIFKHNNLYWRNQFFKHTFEKRSIFLLKQTILLNERFS